MPLAAARILDERHLRAVAYPVAANARIFKGALVMIDPAGNAVPAAAGSAARPVVGIADETADNTGGAAGARTVVALRGCYRLPNASGANAATRGDIGGLAYALDDEAVTDVSDGGEVGGVQQIRPEIGRIVDLDGVTHVWVEIR